MKIEILIVIAALSLIGLIILSKKVQKYQSNSVFKKKRPLSHPEQALYWKLTKSLPEYLILPQVSFSRFLYAHGGSRRDNFSKFSTARQKTIDYLICDKSFKIIAAIELDDKYHNKEKDKKRDAILNEAGIEIIRFNVKNMPTEEEIKKAINPTGMAGQLTAVKPA